MKYFVSIIIPCYNQAQYLPEALKSILEQTHTNWECIIVDDGSPDNTEKVAQEWLLKDGRFKYFRKENGGLSSARNYGIQNAVGKYILTLDSDDKYEKTFIEKGLVVLLERKNVGVVSSWGIRFMEGKQFGEFRPIGKSLNDFLFCNAAIGTSMFRKECWLKVGGYDENMHLGYEDWEFYIKICKSGWEVYIIEEILFFYRQHPVSMRTVALNDHDTEIKKYIFKKHKELYQNQYDDLIDYFLTTLAFEKKNNIKTINKIDYKLGAILLKPFRVIKSLFK